MPNPNGAVDGNAQNVPQAHTPRTRSTFPLHYHFFNTHRFGEYIPHYVDDLTKDDRYPVRSSGSLRSYTLKSPLMQNVKRNKDYFLVPMEAILPFNWEKFFVNPVRGDDVLDDVGPTVENFWSKVSSFSSALWGSCYSILSGSSSYQIKLQSVIRCFVILEYFYSAGNLLSSLNCHGSTYFRAIQRDINGSVGADVYNFVDFDDVFDQVISKISACLVPDSVNHVSGTFTIQSDSWTYVVGNNIDVSNHSEYISLRHALQLFRDNPTTIITSVDIASISTQDSRWSTLFSDLATFMDSQIESYPGPTIFMPAEVHCNLSRLWAYQLSVAHYFTNDHIDFVYSAELFRQLIGSYIRNQSSSAFTNSLSFVRNGIRYEYDFMSAHFCSLFFTTFSSNSALLDSILNTQNPSVSGSYFLGYLSALFGYRRSLRYLDYFTGSRSQPLAVVNHDVQTTVAVNNNSVSVIDITKSIQAQRFLNSVNRVRHNFEGYLKGIFGGKLPAPDYHNPFYMAHTDDVIFGQETENTASEQMTDNIAITTNLRGNSGNYMFEIDTDRPCILIGITSYDIARIYTKSTDRSFFHINRFDWFNPFMQYVGDQPIYLQELGIWPGNSSLLTMANFSYTMRHMEFKQKYNIASGGFGVASTNLDNWIFPAIDRRGTQYSINPDWIRSLNAEFDRFYVSLSGWSLGTYFHFIVDDFNSVNASRPMAFAPQILG